MRHASHTHTLHALVTDWRITTVFPTHRQLKCRAFCGWVRYQTSAAVRVGQQRRIAGAKLAASLEGRRLAWCVRSWNLLAATGKYERTLIYGRFVHHWFLAVAKKSQARTCGRYCRRPRAIYRLGLKRRAAGMWRAGVRAGVEHRYEALSYSCMRP
jgi:hypothetical protein